MQDRAFFHNLAQISGKRYWILVNTLRQMYPWTRKTPLNFGSRPDQKSGSEVRIWIRTPDLAHIRLGRGMHSSSALVMRAIFQTEVVIRILCMTWMLLSRTELKACELVLNVCYRIIRMTSADSEPLDVLQVEMNAMEEKCFAKFPSLTVK